MPKPLSTVRADTVRVAGVAWAQHRGVSRVEVRVDDRPRRPARLAPVPNTDTCRQWVHDWQATAAQHTPLRVRANDGADRMQTARPVRNL